MFTNVLLGLAIAVGAPATKGGKEPKAPSLAGEYVVESRVLGGRPTLTASDAAGLTAELTADGGFRFKKGQDVPASSTFKLDPAKSPAHFDWTLAGDREPTPGIYKVDKDTLTICVRRDGTRPTEFESPIGSEVSVWTFRRVRKPD